MMNNEIIKIETNSAVAMDGSFIELIKVDLPIFRAEKEDTGVTGDGACSLALQLSTEITGDIVFDVSTEIDGIVYAGISETTETITGKTNILVPLELPLCENVIVNIKSALSFTVTSGLLLFK